MEQITMISGVESGQFLEDRSNVMQIDRRHDEVAFSHALGADELKTHLERLIVPGDCSLCEWFVRSERGFVAL